MTEKGNGSTKLLGVDVEIISNKECNIHYEGRVTEGMMCAGIGDGKDSCNGDSGGPLVVDDVLVGVASWGGKCGHHPGVYTRLTYVMDYVNDIVSGGTGSNFIQSYPESETSSSSSLSASGSTEYAMTDESQMESPFKLRFDEHIKL